MPILVPAPAAAPVVPVASDLGADAFSRLPAFMRAADDGTVAGLMAVLGAPVQPLVELLTAPDIDPDRVPFGRLPLVAALAGVDVDGVPDGDLRSWIGDRDNYFRGNEQTVARRVGLTLTGSRTVVIEAPYLGDHWRVRVTTVTGETPDPSATQAAARAEVPAWLRLDYRHISGLTYAGLSGRYATYSALGATGMTYGQLQQEV